MSRNVIWWIGLCAAAILVAGRGRAAGEPWRAAEQPELKQALEKAPVLQTESLGEPARGVNVWERWMVPNMDGKTWDVLQIYFKEYYGPTWLFAMDLGTGQVKKQRLPDNHQFYLSGRALGLDGKYYIATPSRRTWNMHLFVYDPATNTLEERGEIVPGLGGEVRPLVVGPDGRIYGTGTRGNRVGLYIYDPKLGKVVKDFGPVGPSHPNGAWSRYVMGVDDTHAYIASGMIPAWYLVAVNLQTGEEKVLLESPTERVMDIVESFPGAWAIVPQEQGAPRKEYWLYHGQAIPKTGDTPPWPPKASPWEKGAKSKPQVYYDQIDPDADGNATLWYRSPEDAASARPKGKPQRGAAANATPEDRGWKSIHVKGVETYPHRINPLSLLPDGRLYGTGDDYVGSFIFDPGTDKTTYLGPRTGLASYTTIVCGGKLYFSGYPGGPLVVYDPQRPWTLGKGGPPGQPAPGPDAPASNPRRIGEFHATRVAIMHSSALGVDGRIYFGGFGERNYTGGGFGWYDPTTKKLDGFWRPLSGYTVHWIAPALGGRLIAISTSRAADELNNHQPPEEAKLFLYDVAAGKIVRQIVPIAKGRTTGLIIEAAPGRLLGLTTERERADRSILYGVDVASGEVLFRKALPWPVSTDAYWPHWVDPSYEYENLTRGPDGFVWTYLKDVLVRIDPKDASVHVVGKIAPVGYPTFVGKDVYLSGPEQLRRVRNIVPKPSVHAQGNLPYTTYTSFDQLLKGRNARYATITRVSGPGTSAHRAYTGFFFYQILQFDTTGRYLLGLKVYCQTRDVQPDDLGDIGYIDLKDGYKWTRIGRTTAWNWQQGARLQWRPQSDEIVWNDRAGDGKKFVCRTYNFRTGARRTLPRPIYDISPDGARALTHDFERMRLFKGTEYVGIEDKYEKEFAPSTTGIWKMNMETGTAEMIISLEKMAKIAYPKGLPSSGHLYFFREGWNPSGTRLVAFIKDPANHLFQAYSMAPDGTDVRYLYYNPSHHSWQDDNYILDFGRHAPPGGGRPQGGYFLFKDDGTGKAKDLLWASEYDGHDSYVPGSGGDWILSDTYVIAGYQYLFLYHRPTKLFVPLAKLKSTAEDAAGFADEYRVDLHPRFNRDGRIVSIDATHEGLGRQMYVIDIGYILDHPPLVAAEAPRPAVQEGLVAHWKLQGDLKDSSGHGHDGTGRNVAFAAGPHGAPHGAALLNGRDSVIEVSDAEPLHLGTGDFSLLAWVKPELPMRSVFGDVVSKFDARRRRGINLHIAGSSSSYNSMCDARHVHFGIDDGYLGRWEDCGRPCGSNSLVTCLVVFERQLYCGIADAADPHDAAHVFRWAGGTRWIDCGRLGDDLDHLSVQSMIVHEGKLYAGTGIWDWVRARGEMAGKPRPAKPRVLVYEGGTKWRDLGQVGETTRVLCMASFQGDLYVGVDRGRAPSEGKCFKYAGSEWVDCGSPDGANMENLLPRGGTLYGATHGSIFRYDGGQKWAASVITPLRSSRSTASMSIEADCTSAPGRKVTSCVTKGARSGPTPAAWAFPWECVNAMRSMIWSSTTASCMRG